MRAIWMTVLSVAVLTAVPLAGTAVASASAAHTIKTPITRYYAETDEGYGATLTLAEQNAKQTLQSDFGGCILPFTFYAYGQFTDGSWWADVRANCNLLN
jgi:hypothetical protein